MSNLFSDVYNPLQDAVKDPEKIRNFLSEYKLVPYFGNSTASSHLGLRLLYDLSKMSQAKESVINFKLRHGFAGNIDLCYMGIPGLEMEEDEKKVPDASKIIIGNALKAANVDLRGLNLKYSNRHIGDWEICGNMYLVYEEVQVGSAKQIRLEYVDPRSYFYRWPEDMYAPSRAVIFKYGWSHHAEGKKQGENIPVYPEFRKTATGRRTVIHEANLKDGSGLYGRPNDLSTVAPQYVQYCNYDLACKVSGKEIVTKYILPFQTPEDAGSDPAEENKENAKQVRKILTRTNNTTLGLDGSTIEVGEDKSNTIAFINYSGDKPPVPIKLDITRDTKWAQYQRVATSHDIYLANGVHPDLIGFSDQNGNANSKSGEFILQLLKTTDIGVIRPLQEVYSAMWSTVFNLAGEFLNVEELTKVSVKFPDKISKMIQESVDVHNSVRNDGKATNENNEPIKRNTADE